jgi:hypothetical protein
LGQPAACCCIFGKPLQKCCRPQVELTFQKSYSILAAVWGACSISAPKFGDVAAGSHTCHSLRANIGARQELRHSSGPVSAALGIAGAHAKFVQL